jgi:hypothetical protein
MTYTMTCTCGHTQSVDADTRDGAVAMLKEQLTDEWVAQHMAEKHPGEPAITRDQAHAMVEQTLHPAA